MRFQEQMGGEAEKSGFLTEEAVAEWITWSRREKNVE
jgi:antitoxin PrlF